MKQVFADTAYWIALTNPSDQYHDAALAVSASLGQVRVITTETVLTEFLNALADKGMAVRRAAVQTADAIIDNPTVTVLPHTKASFRRVFAFYKARPDKGYSLTDCHSMTTMRDRKLSLVLTTDRHFVQEGFVALLIPRPQS